MRERDLDAVHADGPVEVVLGVLEGHQERHSACGDANANVHVMESMMGGRKRIWLGVNSKGAAL